MAPPTEPDSLPRPAAVDAATERLLARMLDETTALMEEISAVGDLRAAAAVASPHEIGATLRAATRLARVGGWLIAMTQGAEDEARWRLALLGAQAGALDPASEIGPIAHLQTRIDRLADRALRMDAMLRGAPTDPPRPSDSTLESAAVLPFRKPVDA